MCAAYSEFNVPSTLRIYSEGVDLLSDTGACVVPRLLNPGLA